jgi:hypothetical protein
MAFVAWAIGSAVTLVVENAEPQYATALSSMVVDGVDYWALRLREAGRPNRPSRGPYDERSMSNGKRHSPARQQGGA